MSSSRPSGDEASRRLPDRPSLEQLRKQAKDLLRDARAGDPTALARVVANHSSGAPILLADAQLALAREYGFASWPRLRRHVERDVLFQPIPGNEHGPIRLKLMQKPHVVLVELANVGHVVAAGADASFTERDRELPRRTAVDDEREPASGGAPLLVDNPEVGVARVAVAPERAARRCHLPSSR